MTPALLRSIGLYTVDLPLADPFEHASSGRVETLEEVVLRLETDDGAVGWGEVRGNAHYATGATRGQILGLLRDLLLPRLVGADVASPRRVMRGLDGAIAGNAPAKSVIDAAVHDLAGKRLGVPAHVLLGGREADAIRVHATLPFMSTAETAARAVSYLDRGFRKIKLRVGLEPFERDVERMRALRAAIDGHPTGRGAVIGVDANQAWTAKEAIRRLGRLLAFDVAFVEQPVAAADVAGLAQVRRAVDATVIADESCATPADMLRLIREEAADGFHLKLVKAGGPGALMRMVAMAETAGLPYMIGQMDEGMLATAAAIQCGLASRAMSYELWGYQRVGWQPFAGLEMTDGIVTVPDAPGLGVTVDADALTPVATWER